MVQRRMPSYQDSDASLGEDLSYDTHTDDDYRKCRDQFALQRRVFNQKYTEYWSSAIKESPDSKTLWRRLNCLLRPNGNVINPHSAAAFAQFFFEDKVTNIRATTAHVFPPSIVERDIPAFADFRHCSMHEVACLIRSAPNKKCELDPAPTWLVKQCCDIVAPVIARVVNLSFAEATFPEGGKIAMVKPILKKLNLDKFHRWCSLGLTTATSFLPVYRRQR